MARGEGRLVEVPIKLRPDAAAANLDSVHAARTDISELEDLVLHRRRTKSASLAANPGEEPSYEKTAASRVTPVRASVCLSE